MDDGISGSKDEEERPALAELLAAVRVKGAKLANIASHLTNTNVPHAARRKVVR